MVQHQLLKFSTTALSSNYCNILRLALCSLLLMANCLSAVPHYHPTSIETQTNFICNSDFTLHETYCYRYFGTESRRAFYHAEKQCAHFHSTLVSLLSQEEEDFVVQLATNNTAFWIGLNDEEGPGFGHTEGVFKWTSGEEHSEEQYQNWKTGEPHNRRYLDCVKADAYGWAMATGGCASSKLPFVCKKKACPEGLEWDGTGCGGCTADEFSCSHWTLFKARYQTLMMMLVVSLVVTAISLVLKTKVTGRRWISGNTSKRVNEENCPIREERTTS